MPGLPLSCPNAQTIIPIYLFRLFILLDHPMNLGETRWKKKIIATPTILGDTRAPPCLSG